MDVARHREIAQAVSERLHAAYNFIGGQYSFVSIHNKDRRTLRFARTNDFVDGGGLEVIKKFMHLCMPPCTGRLNINLWRLEPDVEIKLGKGMVPTHTIETVTPCKKAKSDNWTKVIKTQRKLLDRLLDDLDSAKVPYIFYYSFPFEGGSGASSNVEPRKMSYFPHNDATRALIQGDEWQNVVNVANQKPLTSFITPQKRRPASRNLRDRDQIRSQRTRSEPNYDAGFADDFRQI